MSRPCPALLFALILAAACTSALRGGTFSEIVVFGASGNLQGRSNGPAWMDYVAEDLGLPLNNFASSGASTAEVRRQIDRYLRCTADTCLEEADADSLYASMHWSLGVDVGSGRSSSVAIEDAVANIVSLAEAGARNFVVGRMSWVAAYSPMWRDNTTFVTRLQEADAQFVSEVLALEQSLGIRVFSVDLNGLAKRVFANPGDFGFTNVQDPLNAARGVAPSEYVWWDDTSHVTTAYHRQMADETLQVFTAVPEPASFLPCCVGWVGLFLFTRHGRRGTRPRA